MEEENAGSRPISEVEIHVDNFDSVPAETLESGNSQRASKQNSSKNEVRKSETPTVKNQSITSAIPSAANLSAADLSAANLSSAKLSAAPIDRHSVPADLKSSIVSTMPSHATLKSEKIELAESQKSVHRTSKAAESEQQKEKTRLSKANEPRTSAIPNEKKRLSSKAAEVKPQLVSNDTKTVEKARCSSLNRPCPARARETPCPPKPIPRESRGNGRGDGIERTSCRPSIAASPEAVCENSLDDEPNETAMERLVGLTEMFPTSFRATFCRSICAASSGIKSLYLFACNASWVVFTTCSILLLPIILESSSRVDESLKCQKKKILLGSGNDKKSESPSPPTRH